MTGHEAKKPLISVHWWLVIIFLNFGGPIAARAGVPAALFSLVQVSALVIIYSISTLRWLRFALQYPEQSAISSLCLKIVLMIVAFGQVHAQIGILGPGNVLTHNLLDGVYFSTITFTTVGYGDFQPLSVGRAAAAIEALVGYISFGMFLAALIGIWIERGKKSGGTT